MLHRRRTCCSLRSSRKLTCETLESRSLLAADMILQSPPWQNQANPFDANADGVVAPLDALVVINALQSNDLASAELASAELASFRAVVFPNAQFPDINGDAAISESDVDAIFAALMSSAAGVNGSSIYGPMGEPAPEGEFPAADPGTGSGSDPSPYECIGLNENETFNPGNLTTQTTCSTGVIVRCEPGLLPSSPDSFRRSLTGSTNQDANWLPEWIEFADDEGFSVGGPGDPPFNDYYPNVTDTLGFDNSHLEYLRTERFRVYLQYEKALQLPSNNTPTAAVQQSLSWSYTTSHSTTTTNTAQVEFSEEVGGIGQKVAGKVGRSVSVSDNFGVAQTSQSELTFTVPPCSTAAVYNVYLILEADVEWGYWYDNWNPADYDGFDWNHGTATIRSNYYLNSAMEVTSQTQVITTTTTTTTTTTN